MSRRAENNVLYRNGRFRLVRLADRPGIQIVGTYDGKRHRFTSGTDDLAEAKRRLENFRFECESGFRARGDKNDDWRAVAHAITRRHKLSAVKRGLAFSITDDFVFGLMEQTSFRCAVSGVPFSKSRGETDVVDPWAASIDRIENRQGYTPDNVRIVCCIANIAMNRWGLDSLIRLARGVINTAVLVSQEPDAVDTRFTRKSERAENAA